MLRLPPPLTPGATIGVTAPSMGVPDRLRPRLDVAVEVLRDRGYDVVLGDCLDGSRHVSASREDRAVEFSRMLLDPAIEAVIPPWGGATATDVLDLIDWNALRDSDPCWVVGYSDMSTIMVAMAVKAGWGSLHGTNLMDTPYPATEGLAHWLDIAATPGRVDQVSPGTYRTSGFDRWEDDPSAQPMQLDGAGTWSGPHGEWTGTLIGGCVETLAPLTASYADIGGLDLGPRIVFLDVSHSSSLQLCLYLHGMRHAGFFDQAELVLVSRNRGEDDEGFTQAEAIADALGPLDVPVIADVECGHVQPFMPLVIGALGTVAWDGQGRVQQRW